MEKKEKKERTEQDYIGLQEIADKLGVSWNFVRERIVPEVHCIRIHKRILVERKSFETYLKRLECRA